MSIRVVIADDHPVVRDGLRFTIAMTASDIEVVGEASNGRELVELAGRVRADVFIVDVTMPILNGIDALRALLKTDPAIRVILLSLQNSEAVVREALRVGARGFVTKETATRTVVEAIREVFAGGRYLSPDVVAFARRADAEAGGGPAVSADARPLTSRERQVLQLIGEAHTGKEIAAMLGLSVETVHRHRTNLMAKLGIHDQASLVRHALREGIAKP